MVGNTCEELVTRWGLAIENQQGPFTLFLISMSSSALDPTHNYNSLRNVHLKKEYTLTDVVCLFIAWLRSMRIHIQ